MQRSRARRHPSERAGMATLCGLLGLFAILCLALPSSSLAAGSPAWELLAEHGPTDVVPLTSPVPQQWQVEVSGEQGRAPNEGRLRLLVAFHGKQAKTKPLRFNASAGEVQQGLQALKLIGKGNVAVSGGPRGRGEAQWTYLISVDGALLGESLEELEVEELEPTGSETKKVTDAGETPEAASYESEMAHEAEGDTITYVLVPVNIGAAPTSQPIMVKDVLPPGVTTLEVRPYSEVASPGESWRCTPEGEEAPPTQEVRCTSTQVVNPDAPATGSQDVNAITIVAEIEPRKAAEDEEKGVPLVNQASVEGGGAAPVGVTDAASVGKQPARFGVHDVKARATGAEGETYTLAGGHPYAASTSFFFNTTSRFDPASRETEVFTDGNVKDIDVQLAEGFIGNPQATPKCAQAEFSAGLRGGSEPSVGGCKPDTQVGVAVLYLNGYGSPPAREALYNLEPPPGVAAEFGLSFENLVPIRLDARLVRVGGSYQLTILSPDINESLNVNGLWLSLWGTPGDESHYAERDKESDHSRRGAGFEEESTHRHAPVEPFLTNPSDCLAQAESAPATVVRYDQWENPVGEPEAEPPFSDERWLSASAGTEAVEGCQSLRFEAALAFVPRDQPIPPLASGESQEEAESPQDGSSEAGAPSGYKLKLAIPQSESPEGTATPDLRSATVRLPAGLVISPSAANGLRACAEGKHTPKEGGELDAPESFNPESGAPGRCPEASQVGQVEIHTPLLAHALSGRVYLGRPECEYEGEPEVCGPPEAEDGRLFKLFIEAEGPGVRLKLPGRVQANVATGQLTATVEDSPQSPFSGLTLTLKGGADALLANPQLCGSYSTQDVLEPWSIGGSLPSGIEIPGDGAAEVRSDPFTVSWDGAGGACPASLPFAPSLSAGTLSSTAGAYSSFQAVFVRPDDREQQFSTISVRLPPGLLGKLAGVTRCPEPAASKGECSESSRIGTVTAVAGSGSEPYVVHGPAYLTGAYREAPLGLSIVVEARTPAFDLGSVVVRAAIGIDPRSSALTITSDPLPQSIDGVPFRLKELAVDVDRAEFMRNPTSCQAAQIEATFTGAAAAAAEAQQTSSARAPFAASDCAALSFDPIFTATTQAHTSKADGASLRVRLTQRRGEANIHRFELELPEALSTNLLTLQKACTEQQFAANPAGCPEGSVVGTATVATPLLSVPLTGPAYLVSHGGLAFPDLVFMLQGEGIRFELVGHTDIKKVAGTETTFSKFEAIPDVPIDSFEADLPEGPHALLDGYGNLCESKLTAPSAIVAQNGDELLRGSAIAVIGCPPSIAISGAAVSSESLSLKVKLSQAGLLSISGAGLQTTARRLTAGRHTISVPLSRRGRIARREHRAIKLLARISAGGQTTTRSETVKT